jgi:hypothetical protein
MGLKFKINLELLPSIKCQCGGTFVDFREINFLNEEKDELSITQICNRCNHKIKIQFGVYSSQKRDWNPLFITPGEK